MGGTRVEAVRGVFDGWSRGDFRSSAGLLDPHALLIIEDKFPDWGVYLGREQIAGYMRDLLQGWSEFSIRAESYHDAGDSVVVQVRQRGVGRTSGIATELAYFQVFTFRGEAIIRIDSITDREEAFATVGLRG